MGGRYIISGCQLGMLIAIPKQKDRQGKADKIIEAQHLEDSDCPLHKDIELYRKLLKDGGWV